MCANCYYFRGGGVLKIRLTVRKFRNGFAKFGALTASTIGLHCIVLKTRSARLCSMAAAVHIYVCIVGRIFMSMAAAVDWHIAAACHPAVARCVVMGPFVMKISKEEIDPLFTEEVKKKVSTILEEAKISGARVAAWDQVLYRGFHEPGFSVYAKFVRCFVATANPCNSIVKKNILTGVKKAVLHVCIAFISIFCLRSATFPLGSRKRSHKQSK